MTQQIPNAQICPACGVRIVKGCQGDMVFPAVGPMRDPKWLMERVCQFARVPGCINR